MITAGSWRYGDWRHAATGCTAPVSNEAQEHSHMNAKLLRQEDTLAAGDGQRDAEWMLT